MAPVPEEGVGVNAAEHDDATKYENAAGKKKGRGLQLLRQALDSRDAGYRREAFSQEQPTGGGGGGEAEQQPELAAAARHCKRHPSNGWATVRALFQGLVDSHKQECELALQEARVRADAFTGEKQAQAAAMTPWIEARPPECSTDEVEHSFPQSDGTPSLLEAYLLYPGASQYNGCEHISVCTIEFVADYTARLLANVELLDGDCDELFHRCVKGGDTKLSFEAYRDVLVRLAGRLGGCEIDLLDKMLAPCPSQQYRDCEFGLGAAEFRLHMQSVLELLHWQLEAWNRGDAERPPVRFRMRLADPLSWCSMEVEWDDIFGERQRWSSWEDERQTSWYAELELPAEASDISVRFRSHGLNMSSWDICKVSRRDGCAWITDGDGGYVPELISLRSCPSSAFDLLDVVFEIEGCLSGCYVARAWNAARAGPLEDWEFWEEPFRPCRKRSQKKQLRQAAATKIQSRVRGRLARVEQKRLRAEAAPAQEGDFFQGWW